MPRALTPAEIDAGLATLPQWRRDGDKLFREFRFADFPRAFGFMAAVAIHAQVMDHHPEWFNVHATVRVWLTTHDAGGISDNDLALARLMDGLHAG